MSIKNLTNFNELWALPKNPDSRDDEFMGSTLNSAWIPAFTSASFSAGTVNTYDTGFTAGTVLRYSVGDRSSWAAFQPPATGATHGMAKPITLNTNDLIVCRGKFSQKNEVAVNNECSLGLLLCATLSSAPDINNSLVMLLNEQDAGTVQAQVHTIISSVLTVVSNSDDVDRIGQAFEYMAIHKIGTTYHFWSGTNIGNWVYMGSVISATVYNWVAMQYINVSASAPGAMVYGVDFIRFKNTANFF